MFNSNFILRLCLVFITGAIAMVALTGSLIEGVNAKINSMHVSNNTFDRIVTKDVLGHYKLNEDTAATLLGMFEIPQEKDIIIEMHEMANSYIVADVIRGKQEMIQERLNALIIMLLSAESNPLYTQYTHTTHLIDILTIWKQGEFFMLANDHNYLWGLLNGEIGYATGVVDRKDLPSWALDN